MSWFTGQEELQPPRYCFTVAAEQRIGVCPHCNKASEEVHQTRTREQIVDLPISGYAVELKLRACQFLCKRCAVAFTPDPELGEPDGVIVFDPSDFAKKGTASVGGQRQWCGRLGKVENCQVGIYLGYVSRIEHALVDVRLYLPAEWARAKRCRKKCGVPPDLRFQTRHDLALEMLKDKGPLLPHAWIAGDDEMGR